jgi:hypothetical protein
MAFTFLISGATVIVSMRTLFKLHSWVAATCLLAGCFAFVFISCVTSAQVFMLKIALGLKDAFK